VTGLTSNWCFFKFLWTFHRLGCSFKVQNFLLVSWLMTSRLFFVLLLVEKRYSVNSVTSGLHISTLYYGHFLFRIHVCLNNLKLRRLFNLVWLSELLPGLILKNLGWVWWLVDVLLWCACLTLPLAIYLSVNFGSLFNVGAMFEITRGYHQLPLVWFDYC
jgi:hypothetical protein